MFAHDKEKQILRRTCINTLKFDKKFILHKLYSFIFSHFATQCQHTNRSLSQTSSRIYLLLQSCNTQASAVGQSPSIDVDRC